MVFRGIRVVKTQLVAVKAKMEWKEGTRGLSPRQWIKIADSDPLSSSVAVECE